MHAASQLFVEAFEVQIEGERVSPDTVFPDWSPLDRFGIVVTEPLGGLGASLLLQVAIALFYSVRPDRRAGTPVYPEISSSWCDVISCGTHIGDAAMLARSLCGRRRIPVG